LTSTSCNALARRLLARVLAGEAPESLPEALVEDGCGQALFGIFVEGLADRFEPGFCRVYARLLAQAVARVAPGVEAGALVRHYETARRVRAVDFEPRAVSVLSRVTLGADVAVTSVLLDAAKRRYPKAQIRLVGPPKNFELFAGDARLAHVEVNYRRGSLRERLAVWDELRRALDIEGGLVLDPDSRLTQLGLLPVCEAARYRLFESRAYGGDGAGSLPELAAAWARETLGIDGARRYIALAGPLDANGGIAVSLGVGENAAKRLDHPFEEKLLRLLGETGLPIAIDRGAGGEERERVERAAARSGARVRFCDGSFAGFARVIAGSRLFVGYDSAGQHVAAACGVPLVSVFAGFPAPRMFERWKPVGEKADVLRIDDRNGEAALSRVREAVRRGLGS
jgi:ADP-heptose:LPS heptosyltransferase